MSFVIERLARELVASSEPGGPPRPTIPFGTDRVALARAVEAELERDAEPARDPVDPMERAGRTAARAWASGLPQAQRLALVKAAYVCALPSEPGPHLRRYLAGWSPSGVAIYLHGECNCVDDRCARPLLPPDGVSPAERTVRLIAKLEQRQHFGAERSRELARQLRALQPQGRGRVRVPPPQEIVK